MIGVFDSGFGGISVLSDLIKIMPSEDFYYIGDSLNAPYGTKSREEIEILSENIVDRFVKMGAKAVVIACNTATSAAAKNLRNKYSIPIFGMEPALKPASLSHKDGNILVLATDYTINNEKYKKLYDEYAKDIKADSISAPKIVDLVESGIYKPSDIENYLDKIICDKDKYSAVVLGCTHYLFVKDEIKDYFGRNIDIYDGNMGTAKHVKNTLLDLDKLKSDGEGSLTIENTLSEDMVEKSISMFKKIRKQIIDWEKIKNLSESIFKDPIDITIINMLYGLGDYEITSKTRIAKLTKIRGKKLEQKINNLTTRLYNEIKNDDDLLNDLMNYNIKRQIN